jgi:hypothetical protein
MCHKISNRNQLPTDLAMIDFICLQYTNTSSLLFIPTAEQANSNRWINIEQKKTEGPSQI